MHVALVISTIFYDNHSHYIYALIEYVLLPSPWKTMYSGRAKHSVKDIWVQPTNSLAAMLRPYKIFWREGSNQIST